MQDYTREVHAPKPWEVNTGVEPCPLNLIVSKCGLPVDGALTDDCRAPTDDFWASRMKTVQVHDNFKLTGFRQFLEFLKTRLDLVKAKNPELYSVLGTAGCLCVRRVRGSKRTPSNHCFGMAVDFKIQGVLDQRGDDMVQVGMLELWKIVKCPELYWGVEFHTEDSMHLEASRELVLRWLNAGMLK